MTIYNTSITANGQTEGVAISGRFIVSAFGSFGSGTLVVQYQPISGGPWISVKDFISSTALAFTSNDSAEIALGEGSQVRASLSGATNPSLKFVLARIQS